VFCLSVVALNHETKLSEIHSIYCSKDVVLSAIFICYYVVPLSVCVCADQAHSSVERAGLLGGVKLRLLPADENLRLRGETLERAIQEDRDKGLIPFYVSTA
jgi:hypothetical protein